MDNLAKISYEDRSLILEVSLFDSLDLINTKGQQLTSRNMILYDATMMAMKAAILLNWARLFAPRRARKTAFLRICYAMLGFNVAYYIIAIAIESRSCLRGSHGSCIDIQVRDICSASIHVLSDLLILLLPQKMIWGLSISMKKKVVISLVFATGIL